MQELLDQLLSFVRGAWRFRWYIHLIAWPLCIGGWMFVHELPDQYEASARVYVDTQSVLGPLLRGLAVQSNFGQEVEVMTRTLLSRPNLEKVARMTDMDIGATTPDEIEALHNHLKSAIRLTGSTRDNLYSLTYTNQDPELAKQVVQSLLTIFVETTLGDTRKGTSTAQQFLDSQIKEYESRLTAAEEALKEFRIKNVGMMPREGVGYYERLQAEEERLSDAELELEMLINRRDELRRQLQGEEPTFGMVAPPKRQMAYANSALDNRIQTLLSRLDELLLMYTDNHPDVVSVRRTIKNLEAQKQKELEEITQTELPESHALETNPVYQQFKISFGEAKANVVAMQVRVQQLRAEVNRLKMAVDTIPKIEAELTRMNRDYEVNRQNYETLLARRESAKISEEAGRTGDNVKFRMVDPPHVSSDPVFPNRPLLISVVMLGGILAGLAFAIFMSQLKPVYDSARAAARDLGVPVLGHVSRVWTGKSRSKQRAEAFGFVAGGFLLVSIYGSYMAYQIFLRGAA